MGRSSHRCSHWAQISNKLSVSNKLSNFPKKSLFPSPPSLLNPSSLHTCVSAPSPLLLFPYSPQRSGLHQVFAMPLQVWSSHIVMAAQTGKQRRWPQDVSRWSCMSMRMCDLTVGPFNYHHNVLPTARWGSTHTHTHTYISTPMTSQRGLSAPVYFSARPEAAPDVKDRNARWSEHYSWSNYWGVLRWLMWILK